MSQLGHLSKAFSFVAAILIVTGALAMLNYIQTDERTLASTPKAGSATAFRIPQGEFMGGTVPVDTKTRPVKEFTLVGRGGNPN